MLFKKKKKYEENNQNDNIMAKLYSQQNIYSKLDFNYEHLNKYLLKCIVSYLNSVYKQDLTEIEKYLTEKYLSIMKKNIEDSKKIFKYSNEYINIINANFEDQMIQSVNYISEILIKVQVAAVYHRENIFTKTIRKIEEIYTEDFIFSYEDTGWKISDVRNQNHTKLNDDEIIKM